MKGLDHVIISASAGSGKTYELVRRYLHLMTLGVDPKRIAAMTFTRKAAGEFFNRILRRLVELASGSTDPDEFFRDITPLPRQWPDFTVMMRNLLRNMHRLRLGTLDSFFANVTACFPLELGVPLGASVMAEEETQRALSDALDSLLDRVYRTDSSAEGRVLLEGYKLGTFGREDKGVRRSLDGWIKHGHQLWLDCPDISAWGHPRVIWPREGDPRPIVWQAVPERSRLVQAVRAISEGRNWSDEGFEKWDALVAQVERFEPGTRIEKPLAELLKKCMEAWTDLQNGSAEFPWMRRKTVFSGAAARTLVTLVASLAAAEYLCRCERTRGIAQVIDAFEREYHERIRMHGRLSFADVPRLLAGARQSDALGDPARGRPDMWYRLDAHYDHWMFDEFQDTSVIQWKVVSDLVDEILQDPSGTRSFFAVGDTKQSIYLWRSAEPGLFRAVERHYARDEGKSLLKKRFLAKSYRSCPDVLDAVNRVFGNTKVLNELLPGCVDDWDFKKHESAEPGLKGHATLLWCEPEAETDENPRFHLVAAILNEARPIDRGLTCAVLVQKNDTATALADYLRSKTGLDVVSESQQHPATDNCATLALLAILKLAAHPSDTFAAEHIRMTPLGEILEREFHNHEAELIRDTLATVSERGFAAFVEQWISRLESLSDFQFDAFSRGRVSRLAEIASEFDETGDRGLDAFLEFASEYGDRTQGTASVVQVMTVHKSKGLEFDMVVLPDLDGDGLKTLGPLGLVPCREPFGECKWVLQMPPAGLAGFDPVLSALREQAATRQGFEGLCELYVAMTRAKLGLYMVTHPPGSTAGAMSEARVLRERLAVTESRDISVGDVAATCAYASGDPRWFEAHRREPHAPPPGEPIHEEPLGSILRRLQPVTRRVTPSGEETFRITGSQLFSPSRESSRHFGLLAHALLAEIEWLDDTPLPELPQLWKARGLDGDPSYNLASQQILALLGDQTIRRMFLRPSSSARVWRERSFDLVDDGNWISGVMDRVILDRASPERHPVWLIDFKTDEIENEGALEAKVRGYETQISQYRRALATLLGFSMPDIRATLVFTRNARAVDLT